MWLTSSASTRQWIKKSPTRVTPKQRSLAQVVFRESIRYGYRRRNRWGGSDVDTDGAECFGKYTLVLGYLGFVVRGWLWGNPKN